jgi:hypothetical protein
LCQTSSEGRWRKSARSWNESYPLFLFLFLFLLIPASPTAVEEEEEEEEEVKKNAGNTYSVPGVLLNYAALFRTRS